MAMFLFRYAEHRGAVMAGAAPRRIGDLYGEFVYQNYAMWVCAIAVLPIVLWDLLQFSHRVVGPLVQFQRCLKQLTDGEPVQEIRLREEDLLGDLQDSFNAYRASLQRKQPTDVFRLEPSKEEETVAKVGDEIAEQQVMDEIHQLQVEVSAACEKSGHVVKVSS
jgi:hypothetical protein